MFLLIKGIFHRSFFQANDDFAIVPGFFLYSLWFLFSWYGLERLFACLIGPIRHYSIQNPTYSARNKNQQYNVQYEWEWKNNQRHSATKTNWPCSMCSCIAMRDSYTWKYTTHTRVCVPRSERIQSFSMQYTIKSHRMRFKPNGTNTSRSACTTEPFAFSKAYI